LPSTHPTFSEAKLTFTRLSVKGKFFFIHWPLAGCVRKENKAIDRSTLLKYFILAPFTKIYLN
jgi:hypothetical protein